MEDRLGAALKYKIGEGVVARRHIFCRICRTTKPASEFYAHSVGFDGKRTTCKKCMDRQIERWEDMNLEKVSLYPQTGYWRVRLQLLDRLGGKCCRCGFSDFRALQVDHINGCGNSARIPGYMFYKALLRLTDEELFADYQLLCANCNWIKRAENHELPGTPKASKVIKLLSKRKSN